MKVQALSKSWEDVYHANLMNALLAEDNELINHTFELPAFHHLDERGIQNPAREFRLEFSRVMAEWILSGKVGVSDEMLALNPNAAKFDTVFKLGGMQLCTAYGPRLMEQAGYVIRELQRDKNSRRACIMMLTPDDRHVATALGKGETKCEYICTYGFNFRIRHGALDLIATMRSNNYTTTVCQDVYVFSSLQQYVAECLDLPVGRYYHSAASGHIFAGEQPKAVKILKAYIGALNDPNNIERHWMKASAGWSEAINVLTAEGVL